MFPPNIDSNLLFARANAIFLHPAPLYDWADIVNGVVVARPNGNHARYAAVAGNTVRGFHRIDQQRPGALAAFKAFFAQIQQLLPGLEQVATWNDLHIWENGLCAAIRQQLANIQPGQLEAYNKLRKPVDLYIMNLVAMAAQTTPVRARLTPHLFLPLDSQVFANPNIFTDQTLVDYGLTRRSTYKDVEDEHTYLGLQEILRRRAVAISEANRVTFSRVYFDILWHNRYLNWGGNLFETNP